MSDKSRIPEDAENVVESWYFRTECCCGDPNCDEFETRMKVWGVSLQELKTVTFTKKLGDYESSS